MDEDILYVQLFGEFSLSYHQLQLNFDGIRSEKIVKLLSYMIYHRNRLIPTSEIVDAIWQNEEIDNPTGALKNLVYRLRTIMKKQLNIDDCIKTSRRAYSWNQDIPVHTDVDVFNAAVEAVNKLQEPQEAYQSIVNVYQGTFMPKVSGDHWVIPIATYYESEYSKHMKNYADYLDQKQDYSTMEVVLKSAMEKEPLDEEIHCMYMRALMGLGQQTIAIDHYKKTTAMLYDTLGTRPSQEMEEIYQCLQRIQNTQELDLITIQKDLSEDIAEGAYLCEYGTFKDIYRLQARLAGRLGIAIHVGLLNVFPVRGLTDEQAKKVIAKSMKNMEETISASLRVGDIFSRYSSCQFVCLLPTCTKEDADHVMQRILSKYYVGSKNSQTNVTYNIQEIALTDRGGGSECTLIDTEPIYLNFAWIINKIYA